ncbi:MAG: family 16 glycoside hydrolase, partial [Pirellulaceae bacterium]
MRFRNLLIAIFCTTLSIGVAEAVKKDKKKSKDGWVTIFDGKSFDGWKANENADSWKIEDGSFVCEGPRSHLFYTG